MKTVTVTLKNGFTIGAKSFKVCQLREPTTDDLFEAEEVAGADTPLKFNGAVMARIIVSADEFNGPFTLNMIRKLSQGDYVLLRQGMAEAEKLGEG